MGNRGKTTEKFIEKAKLIHENKYDYSKVEYINSRTKVCIICPEHGEFWQIATDHIQGRGCSKCQGNIKKTTEQFIKDAKKVHVDKYDYSKVSYTNNRTKVCIICPDHGEIWQTPHNHLHGQGCPECGKVTKNNNIKKTTEKFIEKAKKVHGDKYNYSKVEYKDAKTKVCIICPDHGEFWQTPHNHLHGQGCQTCGYIKKLKSQNIIKKFLNRETFKIKTLNNKEKILFENFFNKAQLLHDNKYDYSKVEYKNAHTKICIICPDQGEFWQTPHDHLKGCVCPKCSINKRVKKRTYTTEQFIKEAKKVHGDKYDYSKVKYIDSQTKVCILCYKHGEFWQIATDHIQGCNCPKCASKISYAENKIGTFIINNNLCYSSHNRNILNGKELDIYLPEKKLAIEYNGLHWHSEKYKEDTNSHLNKTNLCKEKGIRLIHIFEDEWIEKQEIVKSRLRAILGIKQKTIRAHKCDIRDVDSRTAMQFLEENHLQGKCKAKYHYGLYYNDELVSLMTFGKMRQQRKYHKNYDEKWELLRFVNKLNTTVYGGASKLLKHFIKEVNPKSIISYADKRWSVGNLYKKLGFTYTHDSKPNYFYVVGQHRENRFKYRKGELVKQGFSPYKSEHKIMLERGIYRIYDCGTLVFELEL